MLNFYPPFLCRVLAAILKMADILKILETLLQNFVTLEVNLTFFAPWLPVLAVDDRHVAFCEYNGSVARIICEAVATLANEKLLEHASDNDLLLCRMAMSNKTRYRQ